MFLRQSDKFSFIKTNDVPRSKVTIKSPLTSIKIGDKKQHLRKKVESPFFQRAKSNFYNTIQYNTIQYNTNIDNTNK